jgi:hypothetical protein
MNTTLETMAPSSPTNGKSHAAIEAERAKSLFCFREDIAPGLRLEMELKKIFVSTQSEFQQVEVVETYFGKVSREKETEIGFTRELGRVA